MNKKSRTLAKLSIMMLIGVGFIACSSKPAEPEEGSKPETNLVADQEIPGNYLITVSPETEKLLRNPLTGWVVYGPRDPVPNFWANYDNITVPGLANTVSIADYGHTFYLRLSWAGMNPRENEYAWNTDEHLKTMIAEARQRGMRLAFRVVVDSRDKSNDFTPQYVKDAGARGFETQTGSKTVWSPYVDDPIFQTKYEKFIHAFAEEFNDSDVVDFIDGYGLGLWGESHSVRYINSGNREKVFKWAVDLYARSFTKVPLAMNYHRLVGVEHDWGSPDPESETLLEYAIDQGYMLRHDAFGMTGYYQQWEKDFAEKWRYKRPIAMEGGWVTNPNSMVNDPRGYKHVLDVRKGEYDDAKEAHVNTMDLRMGYDTESWFEFGYSMVKDFIKEGGYRLYPDRISLPKSVENGSEVTITHRWNNLCWGYCPNNLPQWNYKYKVAFALINKKNNTVQQIFVDENSDPSTWIKGTPTDYTFTPTVQNVPPGEYAWGVAIVDTSKGNGRGLFIAAKGETTTSGWYTLLDMAVQ